MKTKTIASAAFILALVGSVSLCLCGVKAEAQIFGSPNRGTVTPAAQYSLGCYLAAGTTKVLSACLNIATDVNGNLIITSSGAAITQPEIADPGAPGASKSSLYASNVYLRWMMYRHNAGPYAIAVWPVTTAGGMTIGGSSVVNGINTESVVAGNTSGTGMFTEDASGNGSFTALGTISSSAGATSNGTSTLSYDTTAGNFHGPIAGADAIIAGFASAGAANRFPKIVDATHGLLANSSLSENAGGTLATYAGTLGLTLNGNAAQYTSTQGSFATSNPFITHTATWNAAVAFNDYFSNLTCTSAAANSTHFDFQIATVSQFKLNYAGANCTTPQLISLGGIILSGAAGAPTTISTSTPNAGINIFPNGMGVIGLNVGTGANPTYQATGSASNTGVEIQTTAILWTATGTGVAAWTANGSGVGNNKVYGFSSTATANGAPDAATSRDTAGILDFGNGTASNTSALTKSGMTVRVAADFTTAANTSLQQITGLSWVLPATGTHTFNFLCHITYSQATAVAAVAFGYSLTANPTNFNAAGQENTSLTAFTTGAIRNVTALTTGATIVSATPSAAGALGTAADMFEVTLHGMLENAAATAQTFGIMVSTATSGDAVTIYRDGECHFTP